MLFGSVAVFTVTEPCVVTKVPVVVDEPCEATSGCEAGVKQFNPGASGIARLSRFTTTSSPDVASRSSSTTTGIF